jgi:capsid protein
VKAANGFTATDSNLDSGYTNIGKNVLKNTGGLLISSLNAGEKYESHDTKRPNVNFETFVDSVTKYASATLSMPIEVLNMAFGSNFSASRAALKLYWQSLSVWRNNFVSDFLTPVYNSWLLGEVGTGNIILRNFENPVSRVAWQSAKWIGVPSPSIDPVKEEKAAKMRVEEGFSTREQEAQSRNGSSFDSNVDRLTSENKRLADANEPLAKQPEIEGAAA